MEESELCGSEEDVSCVLCRVSEWALPVSVRFVVPYSRAYVDPLFILVKAISNENLPVDSAYEPQHFWVHLNGKPICSI